MKEEELNLPAAATRAEQKGRGAPLDVESGGADTRVMESPRAAVARAWVARPPAGSPPGTGGNSAATQDSPAQSEATADLDDEGDGNSVEGDSGDGEAEPTPAPQPVARAAPVRPVHGVKPRDEPSNFSHGKQSPPRGSRPYGGSPSDPESDRRAAQARVSREGPSSEDAAKGKAPRPARSRSRSPVAQVTSGSPESLDPSYWKRVLAQLDDKHVAGNSRELRELISSAIYAAHGDEVACRNNVR